MTRVVKAKTIAANYGVAISTVLSWARRGWVPCLRAGRRPVLFSAADVDRALRRRGERKGEEDVH